jgi:succinate dehydrogenase/fumarate reductase cytochrome b subunit
MVAMPICFLLGDLLFQFSVQPFGKIAEWVITGLWLVSFPVGITTLVIEKRKGTKNYKYPILLLLMMSVLFLFMWLTAGSMIL